jgi:ribosomal protein L16 Arg81 hydroxylase
MLPKVSTLVNFGIGLFLQTEENIQTSFQKLEQRFSELKELGEKEKTEQLYQIEELLKKGIRDTRKIETEFQKFFTHLIKKEESSPKNPKIPTPSDDFPSVKLKKTKKNRAA